METSLVNEVPVILEMISSGSSSCLLSRPFRDDGHRGNSVFSERGWKYGLRPRTVTGAQVGQVRVP